MIYRTVSIANFSQRMSPVVLLDNDRIHRERLTVRHWGSKKPGEGTTASKPKEIHEVARGIEEKGREKGSDGGREMAGGR